jgi:hypothetical protein
LTTLLAGQLVVLPVRGLQTGRSGVESTRKRSNNTYEKERHQQIVDPLSALLGVPIVLAESASCARIAETVEVLEPDLVVLENGETDPPFRFLGWTTLTILRSLKLPSIVIPDSARISDTLVHVRFGNSTGEAASVSEQDLAV